MLSLTPTAHSSYCSRVIIGVNYGYKQTFRWRCLSHVPEMSVLNSSLIRLIPRRHSSRKLQMLLQLEHREHGWAVGSPSASCSESPRIRFRHGDLPFRLTFLSSWSRISNDQSGGSFQINYPKTIMLFDAMQSELMTDVTYVLKLLRRHNPVQCSPASSQWRTEGDLGCSNPPPRNFEGPTKNRAKIKPTVKTV